MSLTAALDRHSAGFHPVVPFDPARDRLYPFDFSENGFNENSRGLSQDDIADTAPAPPILHPPGCEMIIIIRKVHRGA
jgi:hypothetical protein